MKWIGQQIYDQIVRFRNQVFFEADTVTFTSANADDPQVIIENTTDDDQGSRLILQKLRADDAVASGQNLGEIWFTGQDNGQNFEEYAYIIGEIDVSTHGQESGKLILGVAAHDGTNQPGLILTGGSVSTEVDAAIGIGASSVTTVAGTLTMGSTATINNSGVIQVATQGTIDHNSLANFVENQHIDWTLSSGGTIHASNIPTATSITSLGTLTALDVDDINLNGKRITIAGDTDDSFNILTGAAGATTLTTIDAGGTAGHFEVAADGDITLDSAAAINFEATGDITATTDNFYITSANSTDPNFQLTNTTNDATGPRFRFLNNRGVDGVDNDETGRIEFWSYDDGTPTGEQYATIVGTIHDATTTEESGKLELQVASHDGGSETGLSLVGGSVDTEVDVTIGNGTESRTTIVGTLHMGETNTLTNAGLLAVANQSNITGLGTITSGVWRGTAIDHAYIGADAIESDNIADDAVNSEHYVDGSIDTAHIGDDQVTFAKASGVTPNVFGSVIKLIPSDFMANDDGGNTKFGVGYVEAAGSLYGMRTANNATELFAFVSIPEGMTATHVMIYDKNDLAVEVFEAQINATTMSSKGSGNANTIIDITDVASTSKNFLAIQVTTTSATNDKVYGGEVTIA